jgi:hypothetical protein
MKTRNLIFGLAVLIITLSACREITVKTTVNRDGSFTRMITVKADSSEAFKMELPYPVDSSWSMASKKDSAGKGKFIVTYTKQFQDIEELNEGIGRDTSWFRQLVRHIGISKRFGFFYSYMEYKEVYPAANPFTAIPYKDHLTSEDILWLTRRHPVQNPSDSVRSKEAEDKVMAYLVESAAAEVEKIMADAIRKLNDPHLDAKMVSSYHGSICAALSKWNVKDGGEFIDSLRQWTGNSAVDRLKQIQPPLLKDFNTKTDLLAHLLMMEEFHVEVEMPGLITGTNSQVLNGNRVTWDVFPMDFLLEDYTMVVESRVINVWAFILSGLVALGLLSLLVFKAFKR